MSEYSLNKSIFSISTIGPLKTNSNKENSEISKNDLSKIDKNETTNLSNNEIESLGIINKEDKNSLIKLFENRFNEKISMKANQFCFNIVPKEVRAAPKPTEMPTTKPTINEDAVETNLKINKAYDKIDRAFTNYLGVNDVANWTTFGKHASKNFGSQLEVLRAVTSLNQNDPKVLEFFKSLATKPQMVPQSTKTLVNTEVTEVIKMVYDTFDDLKKNYDINSSLFKNTIKSSAKSFISNISDKPKPLYKALAKGNSEIFANIYPAYNTFLKGEKSIINGKSQGLKALKDAGYYKKDDKTIFVDKNHKDPQGFIFKGFTCYTEAKNLFAKSKNKNDQYYKQGVEKMKLGNLYIGIQEQLCIVQKPDIFGNPEIAKMVNLMKNLSSIKDANGTHGVLYSPINKSGEIDVSDAVVEVFNNLDQGKGWSDFATRMGFIETTSKNKNAIQILMPDGKNRYFIINNRSDKYTISTYFNNNVSGLAAKNNIEKFK